MQETIRRECLRDAAYFIGRYCQIRPKEGGALVPFRLFAYQRALLADFLTYPELIILKARQLGVTELVAAFCLWCTLQPGFTAIVISEKEDKAKEFVRRVHVMHANLPDFLRVPLANPRLTTSVVLANGSSILPEPSTGGAGRSFTAQLLVLDEWAHQPTQAETYGAAKPTITGHIIGISTALGAGSFFHRHWLEAREGRTAHPVFLPWNARPDRDAAWYDAATSGYPDWLRAQEFPSTEDEAFALSGRPRFDQAALTAIAAQGQEPTTTILGDGAELIWEAPTPKGRYVCGADTAEGLAKGDYDAAVILDWATGQEVAALHGHWPMDVYAAHLARLCSRYNHALLGVERNNHGHSVLLALQSIERYPSASLYRHTEYDKHGNTGAAPVGWQTSSKSKPIMIDALAVAIREMGASPPARMPAYRNRSFVGEARTYAVLDNGGTGASGSLHDDWVVAYAIAEQMRAVASRRAPIASPGGDAKAGAGIIDTGANLTPWLRTQ